MNEGFPKDHTGRIELLKKVASGTLTDEEKAMIKEEKRRVDGVGSSPPNKKSIADDEMLEDARKAEDQHRETLGKDYE